MMTTMDPEVRRGVGRRSSSMSSYAMVNSRHERKGGWKQRRRGMGRDGNVCDGMVWCAVGVEQLGSSAEDGVGVGLHQMIACFAAILAPNRAQINRLFASERRR